MPLSSCTEDYHLQRIVFIDSYRQGDIVEIESNGHTNINGFNASGKTTLLRTIPLFYGETASRVLRGETSKRNFVDHYLPRSTSYLIFEYWRRGQACMSVLHSNTVGDAVLYRFVAAGYDRALFIVDRAIVESGQLLRHVEKQGIECTRPFSRTDYRAVIQNDADKRELRPFAARFAFTGGANRLTNIERVVTGMFVRATTFRDLRQIIVSSITQTEGALEIGASKEAMALWLRDHDAYAVAMNELPRVESIATQYAIRTKALSQLSLAKGWLVGLGRDLNARHASANARVADLDREVQRARDNAAARTTQTSLALEAARKDQERACQATRSLDQAFENYQREKMRERAQSFDDLPRMQAQLAKDTSTRGELLDAHRSIDHTFKLLEMRATESANARIESELTHKDPIHEQARRQDEALSASNEARIAEIRKSHDGERAELDAEISDIRELIGSLAARVETADASPDLLIQLEAKTEAGNAARAAMDKARHTQEQARSASSRSQQRFDKADADAAAAAKRLDSRRQEIADALLFDGAAPGSLLHYLRQNMPAWGETIGRLVPREIMLRSDLEPDRCEQSSAALYGITLNLGRLPVPWHASEDAIKARLAALNESLQSDLAQKQDAETELASAAGALDQAKTLLRQAADDLATCDDRHRALSSESVSLKRQADESRRRAREIANEALAEAKGRLQVLQGEALTIKNRLDAALHAQMDLHTAALGDIGRARAESLARVDASIARARQDLAAELATIGADRRRALAEHGIPADTLERIDKNIEALQRSIESAQADTGVVAQYRNWIRDQWPLRSGYQAQAEETARHAEGLEREIRHIAEDRERTVASLMKQLAEAENVTARLDSERSAVASRLDHLAGIVANEEAAAQPCDAAHTLAFLSDLINTTRKRLKEADEAIGADLDRVTAAFTRYRDTAPEKFYETYRPELQSASSDQRARQCLSVFEEWFSVRHQEARRILRDRASLLGQTVGAFKGELDRFQNAAQRFSRELQSCIDGTVDFDRITGVKARISSTVHELGYWKAISDFDTEFHLWHERADDSLPHEDYCAALRRVVTAFGSEQGLSADLVDLVQLEIDLVENGRAVTVRNEGQLEHASSTGLSYLLLITLFAGFLQRIRRDAPVQVLCSVDELRNIDLPNTERLFNLLDRHRITLISAFPDADPEILRLFRNRYTVLPERRVARVELDRMDDDLEAEPAAHEAPGLSASPAKRSMPAQPSEAHTDSPLLIAEDSGDV